MQFFAFESGGDLIYTYGGGEHRIPAAVSVHHEVLLEVLTSNIEFAAFAQAPSQMRLDQVATLRESYCIKSGLPVPPEDTLRLFQVLETAAEELELDLQRIYGYDLVSLFRERRWRRLLGAIDRIPRASLFYQRLLNDKEYARKLLEAQKSKPKQKGTLVSETTAEVEELQEVNRRVGMLLEMFASANGGKYRAEPRPGMITVLQEVDYRERERSHHQLAARVLPSRKSVE